MSVTEYTRQLRVYVTILSIRGNCAIMLLFWLSIGFLSTVFFPY